MYDNISFSKRITFDIDLITYPNDPSRIEKPPGV